MQAFRQAQGPKAFEPVENADLKKIKKFLHRFFQTHIFAPF